MSVRETAQILIIDTDLQSGRFVHQALLSLGHQGHIATELDVALNFAKESQPEIIILDANPHTGSGIGAIPALFEASPSSPIIVTTTDSTQQAEKIARDSGAFDVLVKPFRDSALLSTRLNISIQTSRALRERDFVIADLNKKLAATTQLQEQLTETSEELEQLKALRAAGIDPATGLLSEEAFMQRLKSEAARALRYSRPVATGILHIDGYTTIANRFGEEIAEATKHSVGAAVMECLRDIDLVGAFGEGEIGFILPETDKSDAYVACERVRIAVENAGAVWNNEKVKVTVTIGYASIPTDTMNGNGLLASARGACQAAASISTNRVLGFQV